VAAINKPLKIILCKNSCKTIEENIKNTKICKVNLTFYNSTNKREDSIPLEKDLRE